MGGFFMGFDYRAHKRTSAQALTSADAQAYKRRPERTLTRSKREGVPASKRKPIKK